jgi:hypothetical protein
MSFVEVSERNFTLFVKMVKTSLDEDIESNVARIVKSAVVPGDASKRALYSGPIDIS